MRKLQIFSKNSNFFLVLILGGVISLSQPFTAHAAHLFDRHLVIEPYLMGPEHNDHLIDKDDDLVRIALQIYFDSSTAANSLDSLIIDDLAIMAVEFIPAETGTLYGELADARTVTLGVEEDAHWINVELPPMGSIFTNAFTMDLSDEANDNFWGDSSLIRGDMIVRVKIGFNAPSSGLGLPDPEETPDQLYSTIVTTVIKVAN